MKIEGLDCAELKKINGGGFFYKEAPWYGTLYDTTGYEIDPMTGGWVRIKTAY